jgi:PAS domain-containing protein
MADAGLWAEDILGLSYAGFFTPEERGLAEKFWATGLEAPGSSLESRLVTADGGIVSVLLAVTPMRNDDGKLAGALAMVTDITDRKAAEEAIRESEELHRALFETINQGIVYYTGQGRITSMNPAALEILGRSKEEMQHRAESGDWPPVCYPDGSPCPVEDLPLFQALQGRTVKGAVRGIRNPRDGNYRWIKVDAYPQFRPGEPKPYRLFSAFEDISQRKWAEDELARYHQHLETNGARNGPPNSTPPTSF